MEGQYRHLSFRIALLACAVGVTCSLDVEGAFAIVPHCSTGSAAAVLREPHRPGTLVHDPFCAAAFAPVNGRVGLTPEKIEES